MQLKALKRSNKSGKGRQVAALPFRWNDQGRLEVLLVTSRDTGRWVLPKGWHMKGKTSWDAAGVEAREEAGVKGKISENMTGTYSYGKRFDDGSVLPTKVSVYPLEVKSLEKTWKERGQRKRKWFSLKRAAKLVNENDLSELLLEFRRISKRARFSKKRTAKKV